MDNQVKQTYQNRAPIVRSYSCKQLWIKISQYIPWDELAEYCYQRLSAETGRPAKDARLVIDAVIIKHKLSLSDVAIVLTRMMAKKKTV